MKNKSFGHLSYSITETPFNQQSQGFQSQIKMMDKTSNTFQLLNLLYE